MPLAPYRIIFYPCIWSDGRTRNCSWRYVVISECMQAGITCIRWQGGREPDVSTSITSCYHKRVLADRCWSTAWHLACHRDVACTPMILWARHCYIFLNSLYLCLFRGLISLNHESILTSRESFLQLIGIFYTVLVTMVWTTGYIMMIAGRSLLGGRKVV